MYDDQLIVFFTKYKGEFFSVLITAPIAYLTFYLKYRKQTDTARLESAKQTSEIEFALIDKYTKNFATVEAVLQEQIKTLREQNDKLLSDLNNLGKKVVDLRVELEILRVQFRVYAKTIITADENGIITEIIGNCESMFGWLQEDLIGFSIEKLIPPNARAEHHNSFTRRINSKEELKGKTIRFTFALTKSAEEVPVKIELQVFKSKENKFVAIAEISRI